MSNLLLAFYGDDFTGSTDALECLCSAGVATILFIDTPTEAQLRKYPHLQAIGIAGKTRSLSPVAMEEVLIPAFTQLKKLNPQHVHYKVCSTFDSSPTIGSIGKAIECGVAVVNRKLIPLLVAAPSLGRYCVFGNLFAQMGIGSAGKIFRLDRHPSMSKHPVTPADESDLRLHLSKQTELPVELLDILQLNKSEEAIKKITDDLSKEQTCIVLIDALYEEQLLPIGKLLHAHTEHGTLFSAGSSGVEMALGKYWNSQGITLPKLAWESPGKADPLLVISGSCSPVTAAQIIWAKQNGFEEIILDKQIFNTEIGAENLIEKMVSIAIGYILEGKSLVIHTGRKHAEIFSAELTGTVLGQIAKKVICETKIKRLVISGGDTSSYAARALEIEAVTMMAPLVKGAPLCKAISSNKHIDELEVNFKGGQVGAADYFGVLREGQL